MLWLTLQSSFVTDWHSPDIKWQTLWPGFTEKGKNREGWMTATCTGDPQPFTKSTESCKEANGSLNPRVFSAWDASELERKRMCQRWGIGTGAQGVVGSPSLEVFSVEMWHWGRWAQWGGLGLDSMILVMFSNLFWFFTLIGTWDSSVCSACMSKRNHSGCNQSQSPAAVPPLNFSTAVKYHAGQTCLCFLQKKYQVALKIRVLSVGTEISLIDPETLHLCN